MPRRGHVGAVASLAAILAAWAVYAAPTYQSLSWPDAVVEHVPGDVARAEAALSLYRECRASIGDRIGLTAEERSRQVRIVLAPTDAEFDRRLSTATGSAGHGWELAVAIPALDLIVVRGERLQLDISNNLAGALCHEVSHLFLARHLAGHDQVPRWLDEGLAMRAEGRNLTATERRTLARSARGKGLLPLSDLERTFPPHGYKVDLAYLEAASAVRYMEDTRGAAVWLDIMGWVRDGDSFHNAMRRYAGVDPTGFEAEWQAALIGGSNVLLDVILDAGAGIAVAAFVLVVWWRRRRSQKAEGGA